MIRILTFVLGMVLLSSCTDRESVLFDKSKPIFDNTWKAKDKKEYWVDITNNQLNYQLDLNLRITNEYRFSNLFILFRMFGPKKDFQMRRLEFKLADAQGDWLGSGSGDIYTYRIPITQALKFNQTGVYKFEIEQDMRDNPLRGVVDIGLRIKKGK